MSVWDDLRNKNIAKAIVDFDGGNDDGGVNSIELIYVDGTKKEIGHDSSWESSNPPNTLEYRLVEAVYKNYDFLGEPSVNGTLTYLVDKKEAVWDVEEEYEDEDDDDY